MSPTIALRAGFASLALLAGSQASAAIVTSRAALDGDDFIDWGQVAATAAHGLPSTLSVSSNLGLSAQVSNPPTPGMWRVSQGGCGGIFNFQANFAACDAVLLSQNTSDPANLISIVFDAPVAGGGAQFSQAASFGDFTAFLSAYDAGGTLLETSSLAGTTNGAGDNSAVFLGISRQQADIARLDFSASGFNRYFGINRVELDRTAPDIRTVPEPSTLLVAGLALPLLLWRSRRRIGGSSGSLEPTSGFCSAVG